MSISPLEIYLLYVVPVTVPAHWTSAPHTALRTMPHHLNAIEREHIR